MERSQTWKIHEELHTALKRSDSKHFRALLRESPVDIWQLRDNKECTCKAKAVFHTLSSCFFREDRLTEFSKILVDFFHSKYSQDSLKALKQTLSMRESQTQKTALMFAVQSNQRVTCKQSYAKLLIELGGDPLDVDSQGHDVVHFAAMLNHAALLAFFYKELRLSVVRPDFKGRTPLHLAAIDASLHTADLLIAWCAEISSQDSLGNTPLHLASLSSQSANYRIVRHLLLKGAQRSVKNKAGKTAYDLAFENSSLDIAIALARPRQKAPSCLSSVNPCSTTLAPPRNKTKAYVLFHAIQTFRNGIAFLLVLPGGL
jgi:hypothetical protein